MKRIFLLCLTALCLSASLNLLPTYSQQTAQNADWKVLLDSARSFERQAKSDSALSYALRAVEAMKKRTSQHPDTNYVSGLNIVSSILIEKRKYKETEKYCAEAYSLSKQIYKTDNEEYANAIHNMGVFYFVSENFEKAQPLMQEALAIRRRIFKGDTPALANSISDLGVFFYSIGDYAKTEKLYLEALSMRERLFTGDNEDIANSRSNLGTLFHRIGNFAKAEKYYVESLSMRRKLSKNNDNPLLSTSINNLGTFYLYLGEYSKAEEFLNEGLAMQKRIFKGDHGSIALTLNNLGTLYRALSNYAKAEQVYSEALAMLRRLSKGDNSSLARSLDALGKICVIRGEYSKAEPLIREGLEMRRRLFKGDHTDIAFSLENLGLLYLQRGDTIESEQYFVDMNSMRNRIFGGYHRDKLSSNIILAQYYNLHGNYTKTDSLYSVVFDLSLRMMDNVFSSLSEREKQAFWGTMNSYIEQYNSFAADHNADQPSSLGRMYDNQLATKGLLLSSTQKVKSRIVASGDTALVALLSAWQTQKDQIAKFSQLPKAELDKKRINLDSLENLANAAEKELSRRSEAFATAFDKTRASWRDVQKTLKADEAAIEIVRFRHFGIVPNKFDTTVRVMDYVPDSIRYAALILTPKTNDQPELVMLPDGNKLEKEWLQRYKTTIQSGKGISANTATDNDSYNAYWKPIAEKLKKLSPKLKTVYVSPDGAYNQVNLSTLYNPATKKYVLDELDVRTVTNTKDLLQPPGSEQSKKSIASMKTGEAELFGYPDFNLDTASYAKAKMQMLASAQPNADTRGASDVSQKAVAETQKTQTTQQIIPEDRALANLNFRTLPGTKTEVEEVSSLLAKNTWSVKAHTGAEALEEAVKAVNNPRVLHIATHGFFLPNADRDVDGKYKAGQNPLLRSGLALAGANRKIDAATSTAEDGILTAYEAMNLNLDKTELVVLSACETGLGEVKNGEGVYGLQRAFKVAGAKSLIMSLWAVSDNATQKLMVEFYRQWTLGKSKRAALRAAQNTLRADVRYKSPYYWGAFVLVGE